MLEKVRDSDYFRKSNGEENAKKLLEAKIADQYQFAITKNKITNTNFLNSMEKSIAEKFLKEKGIKNYLFFGGNGEDSERTIVLFYPEKFSQETVEKNYDKILSGIRIELPKGQNYEHGVYLSGILKLGIKREKLGDILVREDGADIIILNEIAEFLKSNLGELTRFKSANCQIISVNEVKKQAKQWEELSIIVSSMRLDNFVAELAKCSRTKATDWINEQKILVNYEVENKFSKKINVGDVITIRGKGKFIVEEIERTTKSEKLIIKIKKYV